MGITYNVWDLSDRYQDSFFFFFSSRRRHTRYWRDWSSDVCSSDLVVYHDRALARHLADHVRDLRVVRPVAHLVHDGPREPQVPRELLGDLHLARVGDRKSVV